MCTLASNFRHWGCVCLCVFSSDSDSTQHSLNSCSFSYFLQAFLFPICSLYGRGIKYISLRRLYSKGRHSAARCWREVEVKINPFFNAISLKINSGCFVLQKLRSAFNSPPEFPQIVHCLLSVPPLRLVQPTQHSMPCSLLNIGFELVHRP